MDSDDASKARFPRWLNRQLVRRGLSPADMARLMEVRNATVTRWLDGSRVPRPESARAIADALGIHIDEVLEALGIRDASFDRVSKEVRHLQPLIDSIKWNDGLMRSAEQYLETIRDMQRGAFRVPDMSEGEAEK